MNDNVKRKSGIGMMLSELNYIPEVANGANFDITKITGVLLLFQNDFPKLLF